MLVDSDGVAKGMRTAGRETDRFAKNASRTSRTTDRLRSSLVSAAGAAAGAALAYVSVAQARQAITTTQELGLATKGLHRNLGIATKEASRWAAVSRARGIDSKALTMGFTTLSRKIEEAKTGTESSVDAFKALGVTQADLRKTGGDFTKQVTILADAFGNAEGSTKRQAAAQKLLGRGYQTLLPMFSQGAKGLKEQLRWADEFGAVMGGDTVAAIDEYTTAQRKTKVAMMGLQIGFSRMLLPVLSDAQGEFQNFVKVLNSDLSTDRKLEVIQKQLIRLSDGLLSLVERMAPQLAQRAGEVGARMAGALAQGFLETGLLGKVAIGMLVTRMLGGPAVIMAAGSKIGAMLSAGMGKGMAGGAAAGAAGGAGAAAGGIAASMKSYAKMGAAVAALFGGIEIANAAFNKSSGSVMERLDEIDNRGKGLLGTMSRALGGGEGGWLEWANKGGMSQQGDLAHSLKKNLQEALTADSQRFMTLRGIIREKAAELDLTKAQRAEIEAILRTESRTGKNLSLNRSTSQFAEQARSGVFVGPDLQRATEQQLAKISQTYNRFTPQWRGSVFKVLKAQEDAVRRTWTKNGKLTREGIQRIKEIQNRRKNLLAGADPYGIAKGLVNSWRRANGVNESGLARMTNRLRGMPPKARAAAARTMIDYARELERKKELPEGTVKRLRSRLNLEFGNKLWKDMKQSTTRGWGDIGVAFRNGADRSERPMKNLATAARRHARAIKSAVTSIPAPVGAAYGRLAAYTNETLAAFDSDKSVSLSFRRGGKARYHNGGIVPAMVSPGELISYKGREIVVPGRPTAADSVYMPLPSGAKVFTYDGQARLAAGETPQQALQKQAPHFRTGGTVPNPRLTGGATLPTEAGNRGIGMVRTAATAYIEKHSLSSLDAVTKLAAKYGLQMTSGFRPGDDGWHGSNRARDYSNSGGPTPQMYKFAKYLFDNHSQKLLELIHTPLGSAVKNYQKVGTYAEADHFDHVHVAMRKGGVAQKTRGGMPGFRGGGLVVSGKTSWFSPADAPNTTADGKHTAADPGFAIRRHDTLGDWFWAKVGGKEGMLRHIDWGPAEFTGRAVDFTKAGLSKLGASTSITDTQASVAHLGTSDRKRAWKRAKAWGYAESERPKPKRPSKAQKKASRKLGRRSGKALRTAKEIAKDARNGKFARKAVKAAEKAREFAKQGKVGKARKWLAKSEKWAGIARRSIPGLKASGLPFSTKGLDAGTVALLRSPGLSWQDKRDILDIAVDKASQTPGGADDDAAQKAIIGLERTRAKRARGRLKKANAMLARGGLTAKERQRWKRVRSDALAELGESQSSINAAKEALGQGGSESSGDVTEALKELTAAIKEQNAIQSGVQATSSREGYRLLADMLGGELIGKRAIPSTPVGVRY
jgi:hypothetical protein